MEFQIFCSDLIEMYIFAFEMIYLKAIHFNRHPNQRTFTLTPIKCQEINAFRYVDMDKVSCWSNPASGWGGEEMSLT